jgi:DNA-binding Xre family transcriptional regulator
MSISYRKLRELLIGRRIQRKELKANTGLSNDVLVKIDKDEYMNLESLEKIARYLEVEIGDIVELK